MVNYIIVCYDILIQFDHYNGRMFCCIFERGLMSYMRILLRVRIYEGLALLPEQSLIVR